MSKRIAVLALASLPLAAIAATDSYTFDPLHTSVSFSIDHLGLSMIHGRFSKYLRKVLDRPGREDRGRRARRRDGVGRHQRQRQRQPPAFPRRTPALGRFLQRCRISPDDLQVHERRVRGRRPDDGRRQSHVARRHEAGIDQVERFKCNPATATAKERCGGIVAGKIKRSEFGMKRGIPNIGDEVILAFGFEGDKD